MKHSRLYLIFPALLGTLLGMGLLATDTAAGTDLSLSKGQTVYVAIYSHIYSGNREHPLYLAATLSIRNTNPDRSITITTVDYYDSHGKLLEKYQAEPVELGPMSTIRYVVSEADKKGGSGANFIVKWASPQSVNPPLVESVMISTKSQLGISFTSRGQVIVERSE